VGPPGAVILGEAARWTGPGRWWRGRRRGWRTRWDRDAAAAVAGAGAEAGAGAAGAGAVVGTTGAAAVRLYAAGVPATFVPGGSSVCGLP
jgi:hypothetical protein